MVFAVAADVLVLPGATVQPASVTSPVVRCTDLAKAFGDRVAVAGVSFDIAPGEIFGLLGPNGAGKTTTIKLVCGLLPPDGGTVTLDGRFAAEDLAAKQLVGYVP